MIGGPVFRTSFGIRTFLEKGRPPTLYDSYCRSGQPLRFRSFTFRYIVDDMQKIFKQYQKVVKKSVRASVYVLLLYVR